ncbi:hypothetical protein BJ875DRAFT_453222 [Amylocarpus encephaloides]|uniref:Uncharacterized protein n=1 Tax=Amylocarpus encephaloides TaxID=45428 RepID=A0A9P7YQ90_9HELO|nr:hypothetical protein BJ875DRAFT_453222 [Amylocarpus encephaloides]
MKTLSTTILFLCNFKPFKQAQTYCCHHCSMECRSLGVTERRYNSFGVDVDSGEPKIIILKAFWRPRTNRYRTCPSCENRIILPTHSFLDERGLSMF